MKVKIIAGCVQPDKEAEVVIYCEKEDREILDLQRYIHSLGIRVTGSSQGITRRLLPEEIFYFEAVDGKVFAYLEEKVWQVNQSLEALEKELSGRRDMGFFRISKSCMVNLKHVEELISTMGNRIMAQMENGETVIVSRHYAKLLRAYLKAGKEDC